jgi:hypothetical protein
VAITAEFDMGRPGRSDVFAKASCSTSGWIGAIGDSTRARERSPNGQHDQVLVLA